MITAFLKRLFTRHEPAPTMPTSGSEITAAQSSIKHLEMDQATKTRVLHAAEKILEAHMTPGQIYSRKTGDDEDVDQLRRTLEFYAEGGNWRRLANGRKSWRNSPAASDKGSRARAVLMGLGEGV